MSKRTAQGDIEYPSWCFTDKNAEDHKEWISEAYERLINCGSIEKSDHEQGRVLFQDISDVRGESKTLEMARFLYNQIDMEGSNATDSADEKERSWEALVLRQTKPVSCGRAFTKRDCIKHKKLIKKAAKLFEDADDSTAVSDSMIRDLFEIFRGVGEFTDIHKDDSVTEAARLYDMFYDKYVATSNKSAISLAFDPAYVTLDDPLPAGLGVAVAAYPPVGSPHGAPVAHNGSTRSWRCQSEIAAHHFLGFLQSQLGGGLRGWVFVCARNATRYN